jgi:hypothetical protein
LSVFAVFLLPLANLVFCQGVPPLDPNETAGERPYEMVWANRVEPAKPTIQFDELAGWKLKLENGAQGTLQVTRAQNLWDRPVARLRYRGDGKSETKPRILLIPPQPIPLPQGTDSVDMWLYGNRWDWENPPGTPPVRILLHLRDGAGNAHEVHMDNVRWQQWWLMHKKFAASLPAPLQLETLEVAGGWQAEWREIFFDSLRFYHEELSPIKFAPRPRRNLALAQGQSPGANAGPGRLPFPTREKTILPAHLGGKYSNGIMDCGSDNYSFDYRGKDASITYCCSKGLTSVKHLGRMVIAEYGDGTRLQLRIWQKSLVVDVSNITGLATELNFGQLSGLTEPRTIPIPYLTYGGGARPCVLLSRAGTNHVFTSIWLDWYRSNGSEPFAAESATTNTARINGGVRYHPRTDGTRNPVFERLLITVSPKFEETLPTVPNPVGLHANNAVDRLWQES